MHRLRSKSAIFRFRLAALLLCAKCVLFPVAGAILIYSALIHDTSLMMASILLATSGVLAVLLQWLIAQRTNCPLCYTPVLAGKNCVKNRHAKTLLGSHRLRVALSILFRNSFRCPYCNEPTALELRKKDQQHSYSRS